MARVQSGRFEGRQTRQVGNDHYVQVGRASVKIPAKDMKPKGGGGGSSAEQQQIQQMQASAAASAASHAAAMKKLEEEAAAAKKAEEEAAKQRAIEAESSKARNYALGNEAEISQRLQTSLAAPSQATAPAAQPQYTASGFSPDSAKQTAAAAAGGRAAPSMGAGPTGAMVAKINEDSGGGTAPANRFQPPNLTGITFGGA